MEENSKKPYGYIYLVINKINEKKYIGQTVTKVWKDHQTPIKERWKREISTSFSRKKNKSQLRYIEYAIVKYGSSNFILLELDQASNQVELNAKENYWMEHFDTLNPEKGYNVMESGQGGQMNELAKTKMSITHKEKWISDNQYRTKQLNERRKRVYDEEWIAKMNVVNRDHSKKSSYQHNMSIALKNKWKDKTYKSTIKSKVEDKWKDPEYIRKQNEAKKHGRKKIEDLNQFLTDISKFPKKKLCKKYNLDGKCINRRIKSLFNLPEVNNYSQAFHYLNIHGINAVYNIIKINQINNKNHHGIKKEIKNKEEFLLDIRNMTFREISAKYGMNKSTIYRKIQEILGYYKIFNLQGAKVFLTNKNISEVLSEVKKISPKIEKQRLENRIHFNQKQFLEDIKKMQKNELCFKYMMSSKTINRKIAQLLAKFKIKNYTQAKIFLQTKVSLDEIL